MHAHTHGKPVLIIMRSDSIERLVILPFFSIGGCISDSSVAVSNNNTNYENQHYSSNKKSSKTRSSSNQSSPARTVAEILKAERDHHQSLYGLQKLIKNFKAFSHQFFVNKEGMGEMKMEMEIGFPTDVKHVAKIGWDGSTATSMIKGWDDLIVDHELFSNNPRLSQLPLRQHFNLSTS